MKNFRSFHFFSPQHRKEKLEEIHRSNGEIEIEENCLAADRLLRLGRTRRQKDGARKRLLLSPFDREDEGRGRRREGKIGEGNRISLFASPLRGRRSDRGRYPMRAL